MIDNFEKALIKRWVNKQIFQLYLRIKTNTTIKMLSNQQDFTAFENKVDEVMKILSAMSSENQTKADGGIDAANQ